MTTQFASVETGREQRAIAPAGKQVLAQICDVAFYIATNKWKNSEEIQHDASFDPVYLVFDPSTSQSFTLVSNYPIKSGYKKENSGTVKYLASILGVAQTPVDVTKAVDAELGGSYANLKGRYVYLNIEHQISKSGNKFAKIIGVTGCFDPTASARFQGVLPENYETRFDQLVRLGEIVPWDGGKPRRLSFDESVALREQREAEYKRNQELKRYAEATGVSAPPPPAMPAAPALPAPTMPAPPASPAPALPPPVQSAPNHPVVPPAAEEDEMPF